ncbi:MAG: hypothetical protein WCJ30_20395 [Deltaproteobacteria bacterium]
MVTSKLARVLAVWSSVALAVALSGCGVVPQECFRAVRCVRVCGGTVESSGCGACAAGTFDDIDCPRDASTGDASLADARPTDAPADSAAPVDVTDVSPADAQPFSCGNQTCGATQICVQPCSGVDSGTPVLPRCMDAPAGCGPTPTCGCISPGICAPASGSFPGCRQDSDRHFTCSGCA